MEVYLSDYSRLNQGNVSPSNSKRCDDCEIQLAQEARRLATQGTSDLLPTSAKIRKILELLHNIEARGEGEKTIIFSQFTSMFDLLEPFLRHAGVKFVRCMSPPFCHRRQYAHLIRVKTMDP